mgnify:CR=1 FL=1
MIAGLMLTTEAMMPARFALRIPHSEFRVPLSQNRLRQLLHRGICDRGTGRRVS